MSKPGILLLTCLLLVAAAGCSDDTKPVKDQGAPDKGAPDKGAPDKGAPDKGAPDKGAGDAAPDMTPAQLKAEAITFTTALANKLPATSAGKKVEIYVPIDNEVKGWTEHKTIGKPGVEAGYTTKEIEDIIDGSHDPYAKEGSTGFAKQDYIMGKYHLVLFIWEMNTATGARNMFTYNKDKMEKESGVTFETITGVKDQAIIGDDLPQWRVFLQKGPFIVKLALMYMV